MSQPQIDPNLFSNAQTMLYTEGQTLAVLVTRHGTAFKETHPRFSTAGRALAWCVKHRAGFIYVPSAPSN